MSLPNSCIRCTTELDSFRICNYYIIIIIISAEISEVWANVTEYDFAEQLDLEPSVSPRIQGFTVHVWTSGFRQAYGWIEKTLFM